MAVRLCGPHPDAGANPRIRSNPYTTSLDATVCGDELIRGVTRYAVRHEPVLDLVPGGESVSCGHVAECSSVGFSGDQRIRLGRQTLGEPSVERASDLPPELALVVDELLTAPASPDQIADHQGPTTVTKRQHRRRPRPQPHHRPRRQPRRQLSAPTHRLMTQPQVTTPAAAWSAARHPPLHTPALVPDRKEERKGRERGGRWVCGRGIGRVLVLLRVGGSPRYCAAGGGAPKTTARRRSTRGCAARQSARCTTGSMPSWPPWSWSCSYRARASATARC